jgi:hypothetical protein
VSRSKGTKETQGINGDAARLGDRMAAALAVVGVTGDPCPYPRHRETDWRTGPEKHWTCGVCHPPAAEWLVGERRVDDLSAV